MATLAAALLLYAAAFQFPDGVQVLSAGALRGLKDTRVPMLLAALAYWGIGMPLGAGLGLGLGWGPKGMWIGLIAGLTRGGGAAVHALRALQPARPAGDARVRNPDMPASADPSARRQPSADNRVTNGG